MRTSKSLKPSLFLLRCVSGSHKSAISIQSLCQNCHFGASNLATYIYHIIIFWQVSSHMGTTFTHTPANIHAIKNFKNKINPLIQETSWIGKNCNEGQKREAKVLPAITSICTYNVGGHQPCLCSRR